MGLGTAFTMFAMIYIEHYIFSESLSADHPVLISIRGKMIKYLRCDGHDHDNAKENDAVFKTGPNCRWWQEGEDMHHTRRRPNWPFLLQLVLMLEFLKKYCWSNFYVFGQWPCSKLRDLGNIEWSLYCIVLEKERNFVNPSWDFFLPVRRGGWVEFWQILTQHIRGGAGQGILTRDKEVSWKILLAKPPHKYCGYWLL